MKTILLVTIHITLLLPLASSAHYIVGMVEEALDGTSMNERTVILWNPSIGQNDNLTDTIGTTGNSGASNTYLIDCELLNNSCTINDILSITVLTNGSGYTAKNTVNITVTGAGFDLAENITTNSPPAVFNFTVEDAFTTPTNEIDLTAATNTTITCEGIITEYDGIGTLGNATANFYSINSSTYEANDDLNNHYTNSSCSIDTSYGGANDAYVTCTHKIEYFANPETWSCTLNISDTSPTTITYQDQTIINELLAIGVNSTADFGTIDSQDYSTEVVLQVANYGNIQTNLSLSAYARTPGDGYAMSCYLDTNVSIENLKYNLTTSNSPITGPQIEQLHTNMTPNTILTPFSIPQRTNDLVNEAYNDTYWRMRVPKGVLGSCNGSIIFGAVSA